MGKTRMRTMLPRAIFNTMRKTLAELTFQNSCSFVFIRGSNFLRRVQAEAALTLRVNERQRQRIGGIGRGEFGEV